MKSSRRGLLWLLLLVVAALALAVVIAPAWIIQPFRPQSARGVEISYLLRRTSPLLTVATLLGAAALAAMLWRASRWWGKVLLLLLLVPAAVSAWFARQNHFEWMFNPLAGAAFARADAASFVEPKDLVLAVERGGEAAAYPVRQLAYHHIAHDTVGGVPIVVTY